MKRAEYYQKILDLSTVDRQYSIHDTDSIS